MSPRRREILATLGVHFEVMPVDIDESQLSGESPQRLVERLAIAKATAVDGGLPALGADTVVVCDASVLGKPRDAEDAVDMLMQLSGRRHRVMTGVALRTSGETMTRVSTTQVQFREIGRDEALRYWQSGEPADKAGGYGIQGLGGVFVQAIEGSFTGVMGLPVFETAELLNAAGIDVLTERQ